MGRVQIEEFSDKAISRISIAGSIEEAERIEDILTEDGIDYAVSLEPFVTSIFGSERNGIAFYVLSGPEHYCRELLTSRGLASSLTTEHP
jgi:hypothetical protein